MKQMTEAQLRALLEEAYDQGKSDANDIKVLRFGDAGVARAKKDTINELMESV